jgi:N-acetylglutamate synthase-like GNAT family acetyltransferase
LPPSRGQGTGGLLVAAAEAAARGLGIPTLYAGSGRAAPLFERCGWRALETIQYHGETLTLLRRELTDAGSARS